MNFRTILHSVFIFSLCVGIIPQKTHANTNQQTALLVLGGLTATGGVYMICKEKKGVLSKIFSPITGLGLMAAGVGLILGSNPDGTRDIVQSFVNVISGK